MVTAVLRAHFGLLGCVLAILMAAGCGSMATRRGFYDPVAVELRAGKFTTAIDSLEVARTKGRFGDKDRLLYFIDAGMVNHYAQRYDSSNSRLMLAEAAADELYTKSISRAAASLLLNDNVLEYAGEDHEVLYVNLIKALNYMAMDQFDEAFVEIRRANLRLEQLNQKYGEAAKQLQTGNPDDSEAVRITYDAKNIRFHSSALARYLSMHMYAADGKFDDARIDYDFLRQAFETQPHIYDFGMPPVQYVNDSGAILSFVGLCGLAPRKEAQALRLRTDKDLNLVQVLYTNTDGAESEYGHFILPISQDYYFKFAIPTLARRPSRVADIKVYVDSVQIGKLSLLEDVGKIAVETFEAKRSLIYVRTVARALAKGLSTHKLKTKVDKGGIGGWLAKAAVDVTVDLSENPDLRCAQFLPGQVYVGDFVVPPGNHRLEVEFLDANGRVLNRRVWENYQVLASGLNLLDAYDPD